MEGDKYKVDVKISSYFKADEFQEILKSFKAIDKNQNGAIEKKELVNFFHSLGYKGVSQADVDAQLKAADLNGDGVITLEEFCRVLSKYKDSKNDEMTKVVGKDGKGMYRVRGSASGFHTFSEEERAAFAKIFNTYLANDPVCKKYLPIDPNTNELFSRLKNGILMCKLINRAVPGTIDERVINVKDNMNVFLQYENLNLAISACQSIGISVIGIHPETFVEEQKVLILGILWQLVKLVVLSEINLKKFPQLIRLLNEGEKLEDLLKLSPEDLLLRWFNYHLKNAGYDKPIKNFGGDVKDSEKYTILLNQLNKNKCPIDGLNETDLHKRAQMVIDNSKKLGTESYITPDDICSGNTKLNTIFTAAIFNAYPGLDPPTEQEAMEAAKLMDDEDSEMNREERAFKAWINSLGIDDVHCNNLYEDCKNGLLLLKIEDKIKPGCVNWKIVEQKTTNPFKMGVNCQEAVEAAKKSGYKVIGIGGQDIREGNKKLVLGIVWQIMREHSLQVIGGKTEEELISWGNSLVEEKYKIANLKDKKISDGLFFIDIMKGIEPRAINWDLVIKDKDDAESKKNNARYAISIARKLGAVVFLVADDIVEVKPKFLLTFIASIYKVASEYKPK